MDINLWSGTDYENNINGILNISSNLEVKPSNLWSYIGENSIYIKSLQDDYGGVRLKILTLTEGTIVTANMKILHTKGTELYARIYETENGTHTSVNIPVCENIIDFEISRTITTDTDVTLGIVSRKNGNEVYIDDITLTTS